MGTQAGDSKPTRGRLDCIFSSGTVTLTCWIARSVGNLCGPAVSSCDAQLGEWRLTASARQTAQQGLLERTSAEQYTKSGRRGGVTRTLTSPRNASACACLGDAAADNADTADTADTEDSIPQTPQLLSN